MINALNFIMKSATRRNFLVGFGFFLAGSWEFAAADNTPTKPESQVPFQAIERIVAEGIREGQMPGAVVLIADQDRVLYQCAFGDRQVKPEREPMTLDTVFDMASLTKPVATATSVMRLIQQGKVDPQAPVSDYLPEFANEGKESITVAELLLHVGGLIPDNALRDYHDGLEKSWERICALKPIASPGEKFAYTDVGFIVLGKLVQRVSGKPLDQFAREEIFEPLGMKATTFNPSEEMRLRAAPTEKRSGQWIKGEVHDPRAFLMEGVAGHAGLFSTASDLLRYGQMMLGRGSNGETVILDEQTFRLMTVPREVPLAPGSKSSANGKQATRTFGWDHRSPYSSNRGERLSDDAFGHGGFTGTVMWIDPGKNRIFIFLSNRLHPDGKGSVNRLAGKIATLVGNAAKENVPDGNVAGGNESEP